MTDTQNDDDIIEIRSAATRSTRSTSSSSATARRPMFIETEARTTESVVTRRMASAAANRSIHEVLEHTKSPTHDRQTTTYTYAQSSSYAPGSRPNTYEIPVMARRSLRAETQSRLAALLSLPCSVLCSVHSQISNGYSAVHNRITQLIGHQPELTNDGTTNAARDTRTSSQSSTSGGRTVAGYNLRSRPVHATPLENDNEQHAKQAKLTTKHRKDQHRDETDGELAHSCCQRLKNCSTAFIFYSSKMLQSPMNMFNMCRQKCKSFPCWLFLVLALFLCLYTLPFLACKPLEKLHNAKVNQICRDANHYLYDTTHKAYTFVRRHTYERAVRFTKLAFHMTMDIKDSLCKSFGGMCKSTIACLQSSFHSIANRVVGIVGVTSGVAKQYCDVGVQKLSKLIDGLRQEREKVFRKRPILKPDQEREVTELVRRLIDEYSADETAQADYALEANGGKIADVRCQEYTDEPRQNVIKFLGIPIVHMSKQPEIIIKHGRMPGQCFPFKGDHGSVVIRLAVPVVPTEFVLEHLPKSISIVGHINSAPNNFTVYALKDKMDKDGVLLGHYFYDAENGPVIQRFKPQVAAVPVVEYVEIQITSNWGNPSYTCLYRFRVHGQIQNVAATAA